MILWFVILFNWESNDIEAGVKFHCSLLIELPKTIAWFGFTFAVYADFGAIRIGPKTAFTCKSATFAIFCATFYSHIHYNDFKANLIVFFPATSCCFELIAKNHFVVMLIV